jgi:acyl carrier protein
MHEGFVTIGSQSALDPQIWAKVQTAFAEALGLDEDEVELPHKVIEDLAAESLDFLDLAFRLERAFEIKIPRGGIESAAREGAVAYEVDGVLTEEALIRLAEAMPEVPVDEFKAGLRTTEVPELFRVATFYNLVVTLLREAPEGIAEAR